MAHKWRIFTIKQPSFLCSSCFNLWNSFIRYNSNSTDTQLANLNAMSLYAYVPPPAPFFVIIPMAPVSSIQRLGLIVNELLPASLKRESNSTHLNIGLFNFSHRPLQQ